MEIGDKVKIIGTNSIWDDKEGVIESINGDVYTLFVDFIPISDGINKAIAIININLLCLQINSPNLCISTPPYFYDR